MATSFPNSKSICKKNAIFFAQKLQKFLQIFLQKLQKFLQFFLQKLQKFLQKIIANRSAQNLQLFYNCTFCKLVCTSDHVKIPLNKQTQTLDY